MSALVTDHRILRGMEKAGFIVRNGNAQARERHWTGWRVRVCHVSEGPALKNWYDVFTYKGKEYRLRYVDGCFHPFVHRMDLPAPAFV